MKAFLGQPGGGGELWSWTRAHCSLLGTCYITQGLRVDFKALLSVGRYLTVNRIQGTVLYIGPLKL